MKIRIDITTKILFLLTALVALTSDSTAQNGTPPIAGARGAAMGNLGVTFTDIHSVYVNQAGLAYIQNPVANITAERRFALADINSYSAAFAYPTKSGTFALSLNYFGFEGFNEQKVGLAYGRKLFDKLAIGAQIDYFNTRIPEYGNSATFTFEIGVHAQLIEKVYVAAHIFSPVRVEIADEDEIPTLIKLGASYIPSEKVSFMIEVEKDIDFDPSIKAGFEYSFLQSFFLRAGIHTNPTLFNFGIGYGKDDGIKIDVAASYHQTLGWTPSLGATYGLIKAKK